MQKWEYNIIPLHKFDDETSSFAAVKLTRQYGKKGWELVQIIDGLAYFKRPIEPTLLVDYERYIKPVPWYKRWY